MSFRRIASFVFPLLAFSSLVLACGGRAEGTSDGTSGPTSPGGGSGNSSANPGGGTCFAKPSCVSGDTQLSGSACSKSDPNCYPVSLCGQTITCSSSLQCAGYPSCQPGFIEVKACNKGTYCESVTVCGATIFCQVDETQCDGYPVCDPGDTTVGSPSQCPQDASCYQRSACGTTIWCTNGFFADGGIVPPPPPMMP